nr:MAG TPA: nucleoid-associated protein [Caudoviricetes sp.]
MDLITLAAAKGYVGETADSLGAVKGAPATIKSITEIDGGHRVTFEWTGTSGTKQTSTLDVMNGVNGTNGKNGAKGTKGDPGQNGQDGTNGQDGIGISKIEKTKTEGLVDTYVITFSDDSTFEYTVTNGKDGKNGSGSSTGEENIIESIKVNGVAQTVAEDKSVDITVPTVDVDKNYVDTELAKKANTSDIPSLDKYVTDEELNAKGYLTSHQDISGKVDKIKGKSLIADTEIERLKSIKNYDDTEIKTELAKKANSTNVTKEISDKIAEVVSDAPESFNTLKEISDWISGHENDASAMNSAIKDNKNAITTLQTDKADKTEIPTVPTNVSDFTNDAGYLTEHQDISNLVVKEEGKGLSSNDYTSEEKTKLGGVGTSQGRNLIPYPLTNRTTNGITYTVQSDGSVLANGTASAENNAYYNFAYKTLKLGDTSYTLSCEGLPKSVYVYVYDETIGKAIANVSNTPVTKTFVGDSTHTYSLSINVGKGTPVFNLAIKPILEMGTIAHAYEPISESNVNLKDAIDKVSTSQGSSQGRNLISYPYYNGTSYESNGVTYTVNEVDGTITVDGKATKESDFRLISPYDTSDRKILELGQTYTLSDGVNQPNTSGYQAPVYFQFVRIDTTKNDFNYGISTNYGNMTWTASDVNLLQYGIRIVVRSGVIVDNVVLKPMLEIGAIAHNYEPTTESNISLKSAINGKADKSKVADVNWTSVDISSNEENTSAGATINYCIKNGICYMSILNIGFKTANQAIILGANSIPKPSSDYCWCPLVCVADPSYSVLIHPNLSGGLEHHVVGLTSQVYSGLFSYPVAES